MEQDIEAADEYYMYWIKFSGQMERRMKALQRAVEGKTKFALGTVYSYDRRPGDYRVILQMKRKASDIGQSIEFGMVDGHAAGESGIRFRLALNEYGPGTGVAYSDDANLLGEFTTDTAEIRRRIRELDLDKLAEFVMSELQKVIEREPRGIYRVLDTLVDGVLTCGIAVVLYSVIAVTWACPPIKRWILRKGREIDAHQQARSS